MSITGDVLACLMRWGLIPYWAKDIRVSFADINAKTEGIE
jgi:putative SOS response-associated peptidase YedK